MRRLAVERLEVDALPAAREGGEDALDARQLAVRDRDAVAERRAVQPLAVLERLDEALAVELGMPARDRVGELDQDVRLAARVRSGSTSSSARMSSIFMSSALALGGLR